MPFQPNLSYSVTRLAAPTLNNAGDSVENPIVRGATLELKIHKWHKDVRLLKAWTTVPEAKPGVFYDFTSHAVPAFPSIDDSTWNLMSGTDRAAIMDKALPGYMNYNPTGIIASSGISLAEAQTAYNYSSTDADKYILFRITLGSDVEDEETFTDVILGKFPNITKHRDPPIRNIFHITTTNGSHTPIRYVHDKAVKGTDNPTGLVFDQSSRDRPGGQQIKFSLWVSQEIAGEVMLDGYAAADPRYPLIYPVYITAESEEYPATGAEVGGVLMAVSKRRLRRGDPLRKKAIGAFKRSYTEPPGATNAD